MTRAQIICVRGVVQGVGFRPYVFHLARSHALNGWVLNGADGVRIYVEGTEPDLAAFVRDLSAHPPAAALIDGMDVMPADPQHAEGFDIRESLREGAPTTRISPDLPVCDRCTRELFDLSDRRSGYPYINCTNCGPRYSIVRALPYDRASTTMAPWPMCEACSAEYRRNSDRRFHAQPTACPACGPHYFLIGAGGRIDGDRASIDEAARLLRDGHILAVKGLGGYLLACDASNATSVSALRARKYRKEKPFAVMVRDLDGARTLVDLTAAAEDLMASVARPIVLAPARPGVHLEGVAPDHRELGVMLPHAPLHALLFAAGAPSPLVMTSGNRSSEPIAYVDADALQRLGGLADAFLVGERPIARRLDDSVVRTGAFGPAIVRRSRGYAPAAVARLPVDRPILAVGADLKNTVTLVVDGCAYASQHIGDLDHHEALTAFRETIQDLVGMYAVPWDDLLLVHDLHPHYASAAHAQTLAVRARRAVQHHRAHVASVLAERGEFDRRVLGIAFDGTGYGDDGSIWGGEFFVGSIREGFERVAHISPALLPGGDAAARCPVQAAAGFLSELRALPDLSAVPFRFGERYRGACELIAKDVRVFRTTSAGRLFDTVAALVGFTREVTYEGQAAAWLENLARGAQTGEAWPATFADGELDWRRMLEAVIDATLAGTDAAVIARAFHRGLALGVTEAIGVLCHRHSLDTVVLSGGVFQNGLLLSEIAGVMESWPIQVWINHAVPANDGGISLGQAALCAVQEIAS